MELFHKRINLILFSIFVLLSMSINFHDATITYQPFPKETRQILGASFRFGLNFTGTNEKLLHAYAFVNVSVAPRSDSTARDLILVYSFPVLKKPGVKQGAIGRDHPFYRDISDIMTVKTQTSQTFSMQMRMACRLSTIFKYFLVKDSKTSEILGTRRFTSYSIVSLDADDTTSDSNFPGDKLKVNCVIKKCNNLDTDKRLLQYGNFLLTYQSKVSATTPLINSTAIVMSEHDNVIMTKFNIKKDYVITCAPYIISCALNSKIWKTTKRTLDPDGDRSFCVNKRFEMKVKWADGNYTNHLKRVDDGAIFTTICTAFTPKKTGIVVEGEPAKVVSRLTLSERTQNKSEFAVRLTTVFRNDDSFCYYPRKTFRCYLNDSKSLVLPAAIPLRSTECEPKFMSFKPIETSSDNLKIRCIIRKTVGEKIRKSGIVDADKSINVTKSLSNKTVIDYGRHRDAIYVDGQVSYSSCDDIKSRNVTCWYRYENETFTTSLDTSSVCVKASYWWLLWLLLLLLIPFLLLLCCLLVYCCRRHWKRMRETVVAWSAQLREKKEEEEEEKEEELEGAEKKGLTKAEKKKLKKAEEEEIPEGEAKKKKEEAKKKKEKEKKPGFLISPAVTKEEKKRIEAMRMYRMFKKRRPFGWRELNDHFLWLSMIAQEEEERRSRSLSPIGHEYAQFRLMKRRLRFGNRELLTFSQTLVHQGARTEEDLATLRDLENYYANLSQISVSQDDGSKLKDDSVSQAAKKEEHIQQMLSEMYSEGAIGSYNQLESFENMHPEAKKKESESSSSTDEYDANSNQSPAFRQRRRKHRRSDNHDDIV